MERAKQAGIVDQEPAGAPFDPSRLLARAWGGEIESRPWLETEVEGFLEAHEQGFLVIEGPAGTGKTTFLADLVRRRGWVPCFADLAPGATAIVVRQRLVSQVMRAYGLKAEASGRQEIELAAHPEGLELLLAEAAARLGAGERLVVVIDGQEETLELPHQLPAGVFFVLTSSLRPRVPEVEAPMEILRLEPEGRANQEDLGRFLARAFAHEAIATAAARAVPPVSAEEFVDRLRERSQGCWLYVRLALGEIERTGRMEFRDLPVGLERLCARLWRRWQEEGKWGLDRRLLATLIAVQEELAVGSLLTLAGLESSRAWVEHRLDQDWRPFLTVVEGRYQLAHERLREFVNDHGRELEGRERELIRELAGAVRAAHARIADRYLLAWGGLGRGLPRLADPQMGELDGGHGRRQLPHHLVASGRQEELHQLLAVEHPGPRGQPVNGWHALQERAGELEWYLAHLTLGREAASASGSGQSLGREVRYRLMAASVLEEAAVEPTA